jgi:hypothetical protein
MKTSTLALIASAAALSLAAAPGFAQTMKGSDMMKSAPRKSDMQSEMKPAMMNGAETMKGARFVRITIQDLTTGQPFSPGVFVTHAEGKGLFKLGDKASDLVVPIAEGGNIGPLSVAAAKGIGSDYGAASAFVHTLPGQTRTVDIAVDEKHPLISGVWMLGNTNDGFSGIAAVNAWTLKGSKVIDVLGYDAGSEKNNEKKGFLGAIGGGNDRDPEDGVVAVHTGIRGDADAPREWNWDVTKPVARVTITPLTVRVGS